jgi:hypothetical protein
MLAVQWIGKDVQRKIKYRYITHFTINCEVKKDIANFNKSGNIPLIRKVSTLLEVLKEHPRTGNGKTGKIKTRQRMTMGSQNQQGTSLTVKIDDKIAIVIVVSIKGHDK